MAEDVQALQAAACGADGVAAAGVRVFNLAGTAIKRSEELDYDVYEGPLSELIAVGIIRPDQLPEAGKKYISWSHGKRVLKNCRKDEGYLNIQLRRGLLRVRVGVAIEVKRARRVAKDRRWTEEWRAEQQKKLEDEAKRARRDLDAMFRTEESYRRFLVESVRLQASSVMRHGAGGSWHAFSVEPEAMDEIAMSFDVVVEAIMQAKLHFDDRKHAQIEKGLRDKIRAADASFYLQLEKLATSNPALLEGEPQ